MKIALYEPKLTGHHGVYLLNTAAAASQRGWDVYYVLPTAEYDHPIASEIRARIGPERVIFTGCRVAEPVRPSPLRVAGYQLRLRTATDRALEPLRGKIEFIYTSMLDLMDKALAVLGVPANLPPLGGMAMRCRFHTQPAGKRHLAAGGVGRHLFERLLSQAGVACVTTADPTFAEYCRSPGRSKNYRKVHYVPEIGMDPPSVTREAARARFGFSKADRVILAFGTLTARKCLRELVAVGCTGAWPGGPPRILLVGLPDEGTRVFLQSAAAAEYIRSGRVTCVLGFADKNTEDAAFAAADIVWVAYRGHSTMSGVFFQAVCCGLPVITANYGVLRWLTEEYAVGVTVDVDDASAIRRGLEQLLDAGEPAGPRKEALERLATLHRPAKFGMAVCDAIESGYTSHTGS